MIKGLLAHCSTIVAGEIKNLYFLSESQSGAAARRVKFHICAELRQTLLLHSDRPPPFWRMGLDLMKQSFQAGSGGAERHGPKIYGVSSVSACCCLQITTTIHLGNDKIVRASVLA